MELGRSVKIFIIVGFNFEVAYDIHNILSLRWDSRELCYTHLSRSLQKIKS